MAVGSDDLLQQLDVSLDAWAIDLLHPLGPIAHRVLPTRVHSNPLPYCGLCLLLIQRGSERAREDLAYSQRSFG